MMNTREYYKNFLRAFEDHFKWQRREYDLKKLEKDNHYLNEARESIELKLRDISSTLKFLQVYKIGKLSWILDWSNKYNELAYIKIYLGPYCYEEYGPKDKLEVKALFLNEYHNQRRTFI